MQYEKRVTGRELRVASYGSRVTSSGFTLIEILVVIAIIGFLVIALISALDPFSQARKGWDVQRKNDIKQYQIALENYSVINKSKYPSPRGFVGIPVGVVSSLCPLLRTANTISDCPENPKGVGEYTYRYLSDGDLSGSPTATTWFLFGKLELSGYFWVVCSDGKSGERASYPASPGAYPGECPL